VAWLCSLATTRKPAAGHLPAIAKLQFKGSAQIVCKSRVLRIFGPKKKVFGKWRKLHNEELHNLHLHKMHFGWSNHSG
jgi:hypothetical protein